MKKFISVLLVAVMAIGLCVPAFTASAENALPIVYIEGQGMPLYNNNGSGEQIYSVDVDWLTVIKDNAVPLLKDFAFNSAEKYAKTLHDIVAPPFDGVKCNQSGYPRNNSSLSPSNIWRNKCVGEDGTWVTCNGGSLESIKRTLPTTEHGDYPVYRWHYDWRLSPILLADELNDLIDAVLADTGASQVNIVSRCLGTNIAYAYMCNYGIEKVNSCVFYASALEGLGIMNALFSGKVVLDPGAVDRFVMYFKENSNLVINDESTTELIFSLVELFEEVKVLGIGTEFLTDVINSVKDDAIPAITKDSFATFPGYWSMVGADYYESAKKFTFGDDTTGWEKLIEQTDAYYELQKNLDKNLAEWGDTVHFGVVAKYGFPCMPLSADATQESDVYVTTGLTSLGATCCNVDKTFSKSYISKAKENGTDKYISADNKIDASTALFPDTTWFIKDLEHKAFPDCVNDLIIEFVNSNGAMTVETNPKYTQYLQFTDLNGETSDSTKGTLTPIVTAEDTHDSTKKYTQSPLEALFKFLTRFLDFIINFFKK